MQNDKVCVSRVGGLHIVIVHNIDNMAMVDNWGILNLFIQSHMQVVKAAAP
jgi:UDP-N-acetylglucosamine pyrophosphorylase